MSGYEEKIFCRKCMIPDFVEDKEGFLRKWLEQMPEEERISDELYDQRLRICNSCEYLCNGMCRLCGCFIVIRAAGRRSYCPAVTSKW